MTEKGTRTFAIMAVLAIVVFLGGTAWWIFGGSGDRFADCRESQISPGAGTMGGPFTLIDGAGKTVTDQDIITGPTLIYFGYTSCPDVCPIDNQRNAEAVDILEEKGITATPVFISIDPERDTPQVMADYAANVHPRMIGLTGSPEQVRVAAQAYKVFYSRQPGDGDFYLMDHSTFTYLAMPGVGFVDFFRRDTTPDQMANRVACFTSAS